MRIALLSDIHGNAFALNAVLNDLNGRQVDEIVCLGDVLTFGPQPRECLHRVRDLGCPVVMGNADEWLLRDVESDLREKDRSLNEDRMLWCHDQLSSSDLDMIRQYRPTVKVAAGDATLLCFHGSPRSNTEVILATTSEDALTSMFEHFEGTIGAGGHTHVQMLRHWRDWLIINPGSIGLPFVKLADGAQRQPPFAEYAIVEANAGVLSVDLRRVPLDVPAMLKMAQASGLPHTDAWMKAWL